MSAPTQTLTPKDDRREKLILDNLTWARALGHKLWRRAGRPGPVDDWQSEAVIGLIRAADRYRPREHGGTPFRSYAWERVTGSVRDWQRREDVMSKLERRSVRLGLLPPRRVVSLSSPNARPHGPGTNGDEPTTLAGTIASKDGVNGLESLQATDLLEAFCRGLNDRERTVCRLSYGNGTSLLKIGQEIGLSQSRVSQIRSNCFERLRQAADTYLSQTRA
jgi:RNA polymerase sigma factor (sigma-70 family)